MDPALEQKQPFSVFPETPNRFPDQRDAEFIATQGAIALEDSSPEGYRDTLRLVQRPRGIEVLRQTVADKSAERDSALQYNMYQEAIAKGDTQAAWELLTANRNNVIQSMNTPGTSLEENVVAAGAANMIATDPNMYSKIAEEGYSEDTARMLMIANFVNQFSAGFQEYVNPEFEGDPEAAFTEFGDAFDAVFQTELSPWVIPKLWQKQLNLVTSGAKAAQVFGPEFYGDLLASFINTPTAGLKSKGDPKGFFLPGEAGKMFKEDIMTIPLKDLPAYLKEQETFLMEASAGNALRAFSAAWDQVYLTNAVNGTQAQEQFDLWKKLPTITIPKTDDKGNIVRGSDGLEIMQEVPNPLYELYAQGGDKASEKFLHAVDAAFSQQHVQTVIDNPIMDALAFMGIGKGTLKAVSRLRTISRALGNPVAAQNILNQVARGNKVSRDVFDHLTAQVNPGGFADPELAAEVRRAQLGVSQGLEDAPIPPRVDADPGKVANTVLDIRQNKNLFQNELQYAFHETSEGNNYITVVYGASDGLGFADEPAAKAWAASKGIPDPLIEQPPNQGFFVKVRSALDDSGSYSPVVEQTGLMDNIRFSLGFGKYGWTPNVTTSKKAAEGASASALNTGYYKKIFEPLLKPINGLNKKATRRLDGMLKLGKRTPSRTDPKLQGRWFTEEEFNTAYYTKYNENPTTQEKTAYQLVRTASDLAFALANKGAHDEAAALGITSWRFTHPNAEISILGKEVGRELPSAKFLAKLPNGQYTSDANDLRMALQDPEVFIVKTYGDLDLDGKTITHFLGRKGEVKDVGLPRTLLSYQEGGTRMYKNPWFLKQQGESRIHTLGNFTSKKEALKYQTKMREATTHYNSFLKGIDKERRAGTLTPVSERAIRARYDALLQNIDQRFRTASLEDMVHKGEFDPTREFHVLYDRQSFPGQGEAKFMDTNLTQKKGRLIYSQRGGTLFEDGTNQFAELVDPFESLAFQQAHAIKAAGYSDFTVQMMHQWAVKYRPFLATGAENITSLKQIFLEGKFPANPQLGMTKTQQWAAEAERAHILRILRQPDAVSARLASMRLAVTEKIATVVGDADWIPKGYLESLRTGRIAEADVISTLKGWAYNIHMGLFNARHLWLQALGASAAYFTHPVYGTAAVLEAIVWWPANSFKIGDKAIDAMDTVFSKSRLYAKGEFKEVMEVYRKTGLHNIAASDTTLDVAASVDKIGGGAVLRNISTWGRTFVYEGERMARSISFHIARRLADEQVTAGKFAKNSDAYIRFIQGETNRIQLGMMSGMEAAWSRNPLTALGMQMLQYPIKATETFLGLNRQLSAAEKWRFAAGSILMWGAYGVPGGPELLNQYNKSTGSDMSEEDFRLALLGGFDKFFRDFLSTDTAFASQLGFGDFHYTFAMNFLDKGVFSFIGGIALGDLKKIVDVAPYIGQILHAGFTAGEINRTDISTVSGAALTQAGKVLSGASNYRKAYLLNKYGVLMDSRSVASVEEHSNYSVLATALGVTSAEEAMYRLSTADAGRRAKELDEAAYILAGALAEHHIASMGHFQGDAREETAASISLWGQTAAIVLEAYNLNPDEKNAVTKKAEFFMSNDKTIQRKMRQNKWNLPPAVEQQLEDAQ